MIVADVLRAWLAVLHLQRRLIWRLAILGELSLYDCVRHQLALGRWFGLAVWVETSKADR